MRITDSRDHGGVGILALQDHGRHDSLVDRFTVIAVRAKGRNEAEGQLGEIVHERTDVGDVVGALLWPAETREMPGWSWAWGAEVLAPGNGETRTVAGPAGPPTGFGSIGRAVAGLPPPVDNRFVMSGGSPSASSRASGGVTGASGGATGTHADRRTDSLVRPLRGRTWSRDARYSRLRVAPPDDWPDFPGGFRGLVVSATDEDAQVEHFHPTDPRMVAPHVNGPTSTASLVTDLGRDGACAADRHARLSSVMRVLKEPSNSPDSRNAIAFPLGKSGQGDVRGGYVIDLWSSDARKARAVTKGFSESSNPNAEIQVDRYRYDESGRVVGIDASHVVRAFNTTTIVVGSRILEFETAAKGKESTVIGMLSKNDRGPLDVGPPEDKHRIGTDADGHAINPTHISTDALFRMDLVRDAPLLFETRWERDAADWDVPTLVHLAYDAENDVWRWWTTTHFSESEAVPPARQPTITPPDRPRLPPTITPGTGPRVASSSGPSPGGIEPVEIDGELASRPGLVDALWRPRSAVATRREVMLPGLSFRPQHVGDGKADLRYHVGRVPAALREEHDAGTPVVARLEAFGAQRGSTWVRTLPPGIGGRHRGGTGGGGLVFLPPEVDMASEGVDFAPPGLARSEPYFVFAPGTRAAWGYPNLDDGTIREGFSAYYDAAEDELVVSYHSGTEAVTMKLRSGGEAFLADRVGDPASTPSGGGYLYAKSGGLYWKGSGGTVTPLATA